MVLEPLMDATFQCLQSWICQTLLNAILAYYDRSKPVIVQTYASEYWLGTSLIHIGCSIAFTGKTLTDIGTHNGNILRGSICQCASVFRVSHLPIRQACHHAKWSQATGNNSAEAYPCGSPFFSACKNTTILSSTNLIKRWYYLIILVTYPPSKNPFQYP